MTLTFAIIIGMIIGLSRSKIVEHTLSSFRNVSPPLYPNFISYLLFYDTNKNE
jgi:hypothetical protein